MGDGARLGTWLGVDVGGTNVRAGSLDDEGRLLSWVSYPHGAAPGEFAFIAEVAGEALHTSHLVWSDVAGMAVAIAGLVDSDAGTVLDSSNLGWHNLALGAELHRRLGVAVAIENDVCASAVAELRELPGRAVLPWLFVSVGTGIGACVVLDQEGHILCLNVGHVPVPGGPRRPCLCGKYGCLETVASGAAFTRAAKSRIASDPGHNLNARLATITGKDVVDAAEHGDPISLEVLAEAGRACGRAVGNLVNLLVPASVGLAGPMMADGSPYLGALVDAARAEIYPWMEERLRFYPARLGERAGVIGAVELARRRLAEPSAGRTSSK